eukprot:747219-Hanusia_phi.AAC.9
MPFRPLIAIVEFWTFRTENHRKHLKDKVRNNALYCDGSCIIERKLQRVTPVRSRRFRAVCPSTNPPVSYEQFDSPRSRYDYWVKSSCKTVRPITARFSIDGPCDESWQVKQNPPGIQDH